MTCSTQALLLDGQNGMALTCLGTLGHIWGRHENGDHPDILMGAKSTSKAGEKWRARVRSILKQAVSCDVDMASTGAAHRQLGQLLREEVRVCASEERWKLRGRGMYTYAMATACSMD